MSMFTIHQRDVLKKRLSRALLWANTDQSSRDYATRLAIVVLDELELTGFSAAAGRRAVEKIVDQIDEKSA